MHTHCRSAIDGMAKEHEDHIRRMSQTAAAQSTQTEETERLEQELAEKEEELANALRELEEAQEEQDRLVRRKGERVRAKKLGQGKAVKWVLG